MLRAKLLISATALLVMLGALPAAAQGVSSRAGQFSGAPGISAAGDINGAPGAVAPIGQEPGAAAPPRRVRTYVPRRRWWLLGHRG